MVTHYKRDLKQICKNYISDIAFTHYTCNIFCYEMVTRLQTFVHSKPAYYTSYNYKEVEKLGEKERQSHISMGGCKLELSLFE